MPAAPQPHAGHPALPLGPCPRRVPKAGRSALPAAVKPGNGPRGMSSRCPCLPARGTECATGLHNGRSPFRRQPAARLAGAPVSRSRPSKGCVQRTDVLGVQSLGGPPVGDCARASAPVQAAGLCFVFSVRARPRSSGAKMLLPLTAGSNTSGLLSHQVPPAQTGGNASLRSLLLASQSPQGQVLPS